MTKTFAAQAAAAADRLTQAAIVELTDCEVASVAGGALAKETARA